MKTINLILTAVLAAALVLVACDNKDKEAEAARLKHIADSLKQDSVRRAEEAANAARLADSARIADSLAALKPGSKTTKPTQTTKTTTQPAPAAPAKTTPSTIGNGKPSMENNGGSGNVGNGKPSMEAKPGDNKTGGTIGGGKPKL